MRLPARVILKANHETLILDKINEKKIKTTHPSPTSMMKKWHVLTHSEFIIDLAEGMGKGVFISSLILSKIVAKLSSRNI